jgi:hypothetical protein
MSNFTKNRAMNGGNIPGHPADDLRPKEKEFNPLEIRKEMANYPKKLILEYKKLKKGFLLAEPVEYLPKSNIDFVFAATTTVTQDEPIFRVLMVGKLDLDYDLDIVVGDLIMVSEADGYAHQKHTKAITPEGQDIGAYYVIKTQAVIAVVDYKKIESTSIIPVSGSKIELV